MTSAKKLSQRLAGTLCPRFSLNTSLARRFEHQHNTGKEEALRAIDSYLKGLSLLAHGGVVTPEVEVNINVVDKGYSIRGKIDVVAILVDKRSGDLHVAIAEVKGSKRSAERIDTLVQVSIYALPFINGELHIRSNKLTVERREEHIMASAQGILHSVGRSTLEQPIEGEIKVKALHVFVSDSRGNLDDVTSEALSMASILKGLLPGVDERLYPDYKTPGPWCLYCKYYINRECVL